MDLAALKAAANQFIADSFGGSLNPELGQAAKDYVTNFSKNIAKNFEANNKAVAWQRSGIDAMTGSSDTKQSIREDEIKAAMNMVGPSALGTLGGIGAATADLENLILKDGSGKALSLPESANAIDDITGLPLNPDGTVTLYHHTDAKNVSNIFKTKKLKADAEPDVYLTTHNEPNIGYGDTAIPIKVDPAKLQIDDEFPNGRKDFRIDAGKPGGSVSVEFGY